MTDHRITHPQESRLTPDRPVERVPSLVRQLALTVRELERLFPGRRFTLDGHLIGSIGEVIAAHRYGLELLPASHRDHDARARDGRKVQIKISQRRSVGLRALPDHLLVLRLSPEGEVDEVYNGPGDRVWAVAGPMQRNGQRTVALSTLRRLMEEVAPDLVLPVASGPIPPVHCTDQAVSVT